MLKFMHKIQILGSNYFIPPSTNYFVKDKKILFKFLNFRRITKVELPFLFKVLDRLIFHQFIFAFWTWQNSTSSNDLTKTSLQHSKSHLIQRSKVNANKIESTEQMKHTEVSTSPSKSFLVRTKLNRSLELSIDRTRDVSWSIW